MMKGEQSSSGVARFFGRLLAGIGAIAAALGIFGSGFYAAVGYYGLTNSAEEVQLTIKTGQQQEEITQLSNKIDNMGTRLVQREERVKQLTALIDMTPTDEDWQQTNYQIVRLISTTRQSIYLAGHPEQQRLEMMSQAVCDVVALRTKPDTEVLIKTMGYLSLRLNKALIRLEVMRTMLERQAAAFNGMMVGAGLLDMQNEDKQYFAHLVKYPHYRIDWKTGSVEMKTVTEGPWEPSDEFRLPDELIALLNEEQSVPETP